MNKEKLNKNTFRDIKDFVKNLLPLPLYNAIKWSILKSIYLLKVLLFPFAYIYVWLLNLKEPTKVAIVSDPHRIGTLIVFVDLYLRSKDTLYQGYRGILLALHKPANDFVASKWRELADFISCDKQPFFTFFLSSLFVFKNKFTFTLPDMFKEGYEIYQTKPPVFKFSESERQKGEATLAKMGIGEDDWFACIFARDSGYDDKNLKDFHGHDDRNTDINELVEVAKYIVQKGGFVVRVGKDADKPFAFKHEKVIDYPFTEFNNAFNDLYIQSRAKFIISSGTSGGSDISSAFNTPYIAVNMPWNINVPYKNAIHIPQVFKQDGKPLGIKAWENLLRATRADIEYGYKKGKDLLFYGGGEFNVKHNITVVNNSPQEIIELVDECFERLGGSFVESEQDKSRQALRDKLYKQSTSQNWCSNPYGKKWLKDNAEWYLKE